MSADDRSGAGASLLALLQLADGLFPAGGFAHSLGLETLVQAGQVRGRADVEGVVRAHLEGCAGPCDAVAVTLAVRAAAREDLAACADLDGRIDAMRAVPEFRAAGAQMGRATLRAARVFSGDAFVRRLADAVDDGVTPGQHPVVFGVVAGRAGAAARDAALGYLHSTVALLVGAALRLLPLGQVEGQQVLAAVRPLAARLARDAAAVAGPDEMWSFAPALEIAGLRHAGLEARLFRS